jgi:SAM-dependent methyltransferase
MRWIAKAVAQKLLSGLPGGERINHLLQRHLTHGLPRGRAEIAEKFRYAAHYLGLARRWGDWGGGSVRAYEFGCGWELAVAQALYLLGVERQVVVDLRPLLNWELVADAWTKLQGIAAELEGGGWTLPRRLAGTPPASRGELRARLGIEYLAPLDARATGLPAGSFELIHSTEVLEHVPAEALEPILRECRRLLAPGGVVAMLVDLQDHYSYFDKNIGPYHYLTLNPGAWRLINSGLHYQNRLRLPDYLAAARAAGLRVVHQEVSGPDPADRRQLAGMRLAAGFRNYTEDELGARWLVLVCRGD